MPESEPLPDGRRAAVARPPDKPGFRERRKLRRAAKKRRIAAMSRKRRIGRRVGILSTWLLAVLAVVTTGAVVLFYTLSDVPDPNTLPLPQVATILYSDGSVMARVGTVDRTVVDISQVPEGVRWDVLAAEDRNFYSEPGVSITGTLRAALSNLRGGDTQGGSGITQQYVKNAYLSSSRTLSRKLKELAIAVKLSREYSKNKILEFYLNTVYFGRGTYGIQAAAQAYFHKNVSQLDIAEGAVLAALLRAPTYYDPANNPADAKARWQYVLDGMVATKHLTQQQADTMQYPKVAAPTTNDGLTVEGPKALIVQRVIAELAANGISEEAIYARGLTIRTTINRKAQDAAEQAIDDTFSNLTAKQRTMKNALVAVDPHSGAVLAYYGGPNGKNYAGKQDYYDYAGLGTASPGSSFKPYTLATALTQTLTKQSKGEPIAINTYYNGSKCVTIQGTRICNDPSDDQYSSSKVKVANAMKYSLNTTFDLMAQQVGPTDVATTARDAGISQLINGRQSLTDPDGGTTFGIGIGDYPVHPIDQAVGFATFANGGVMNESYFVTKATASNGEVVYTHKATPQRSMDAKVANDVTLTLEPIASFSGVGLAGGRTSAAKTGTEGIESGKYKGGNSDAWMVGFTPQVSTAVWVGSGDSTTPIYNASGNPEYGRDLPGKAWKAFMDDWLAGKDNATMPSTQMIKTAASTSSSPAPSSTSARPSASAPSPTPTFSISTGFSSSSPAPTPTRTITRPSPTPTSSSATPSCRPGLVLPDCTSASASSTPTSAAPSP